MIEVAFLDYNIYIKIYINLALAKVRQLATYFHSHKYSHIKIDIRFQSSDERNSRLTVEASPRQ